MIDLSTSYLGIALRNPIVASPSPLCEDLDNLRRLEDAGVGAIVLHSLFEEQIESETAAVESWYAAGAESYAEALGYFPPMDDYKTGPEAYLEHLRRAKEACSVPIIASLNGVSAGGWTSYAQRMEQAGADALELNIYFLPTNPQEDAAQLEQRYLHLIEQVVASIDIPVAVKLGSAFTAFANFARRVEQAGAAGLVLFNRFYQPDLDIEERTVVPNLTLSTPSELRLRLRWLAILYGVVDASLAATGGVHRVEDAVKAIMAGASVTMMTSALLKRGIPYVGELRDGLTQWLEQHEYASVLQLRGSMSHRAVADPAAFERANYMKVIKSYVPPPV